MATLPDTVHRPDLHEHELTRCADAYGGRGWGCDVCEAGGRGWAYQCSPCNFDAHPQCCCDKSLFA